MSVHRRERYGKGCDLQSLLYALIDLGSPEGLPWKDSISKMNADQKRKAAMRAKEKFDTQWIKEEDSTLYPQIPKEYRKFARQCGNEPDYEIIYSLLLQIATNPGYGELPANAALKATRKLIIQSARINIYA